jgi:hypothetical protein
MPVGNNYLVQGSWASKEEYYFSLALDRLRIPYQFQFSLWMGNLRRGGVKIDFLVFIPYRQPVEILGTHWHTGSLGKDDPWRLARIRAHFKRDVIEIWDYDLETPDEAYITARQKLRV